MGDGNRIPDWLNRENVHNFDAVKARLTNDPSLDASTAIRQVQNDRYSQEYTDESY